MMVSPAQLAAGDADDPTLEAQALTTPRGAVAFSSSREGRTLKLGPQRHPRMTHLSHLKSSPCYSIGQRPRAREGDDAVQSWHTGNAKDSAKSHMMPKSPHFGFGSCTTGRLDQEKEAAPGPGAYSHRDYIGEKGVPCPAQSTGPPRAPSPQGGATSPLGARLVGFGSSRAPRADVAKQLALTSGGQAPQDPAEVGAAEQLFTPRSKAVCSPDPGVYEPVAPTTTSRMNSSPRFGFGNAATGRLELGKPETPGPGAYAHREVLGEKNQVVMGTPRQRQRVPVPKPDMHSYEPCDPRSTSKMARGPQFGFGTGATGRLHHSKERGPGPGAYSHHDPRKRTSPRAIMGSSAPRTRSPASPPRTPDSWSYEARDPSTTSKMTTGPKFGFGGASTGRLNEARNCGSPGPGAYGGHFTQFVTA